MAETPLEECQRHVTEGAERIARQKTLIDCLERDGHQRMLPGAYVVLTNLQATQQLGEEHLAREIAKQDA